MSAISLLARLPSYFITMMIRYRFTTEAINARLYYGDGEAAAPWLACRARERDAID